MSNKIALLMSITVMGCAAGQITGPPDETSSNIIGGTTDTGDPSVVILFAQQNGSTQGSLCTASVISPTVLLTAAHCVDPAEVGTNVTFQVFTGYDFNSNNGQWLPVAKVDHDPQFSSSNLNGGHDVGIVVLQNATSLKPLPFNTSSAITGMAGQAVRLVGYGNNNGQTGTGAGIKRQVTTTLIDVSSLLLHIGDDAHETCQGDSGGPAFMNMNGVETIVGVTSFGYVGCTGGGYDTRVDLYTSFIDKYVGGSTTPPPPNPNPPPPPPTPPPTPPPPSSCDWETEPNGSASQANEFCSDGHINAAIDPVGDVDWFHFQVAPNQNYYITLTNLPNDYNFTVYKVINGALSTIGTATDNHDFADQELARHTTTGGNYYVKVFGVNGASDSQYGYTLTYHN